MPSTDTLTRASLAEAIGQRLGFASPASRMLVDSILRLMTDALLRGENVKISSFGVFVLNDKNERIGRNPKTGEAATISARRVMTLRPSALLKNRVASSKPSGSSS